MQGSGLLRVWLEPLGDLSVWAIQVENPSKFALGSRGTRSGALNSWLWYALFFTQWTFTHGMYDTHVYTHADENLSGQMQMEKGVYFFKSILCKHIVEMAH